MSSDIVKRTPEIKRALQNAIHLVDELERSPWVEDIPAVFEGSDALVAFHAMRLQRALDALGRI